MIRIRGIWASRRTWRPTIVHTREEVTDASEVDGSGDSVVVAPERSSDQLAPLASRGRGPDGVPLSRHRNISGAAVPGVVLWAFITLLAGVAVGIGCWGLVAAFTS